MVQRRALQEIGKDNVLHLFILKIHIGWGSRYKLFPRTKLCF